MTKNISRRVLEHKNKLIDGFTKKYNIDKLVYYEKNNDVETAVKREKQIKAGSGSKKIDLINKYKKDGKIYRIYSLVPKYILIIKKRGIAIRLLRSARNSE